MKVRIANAVLSEAPIYDVLDEFVSVIVSGQHLWHVDDPDVVERSPWIQDDADGRAGKRNLAIMRKAYTDAIYSQSSTLAHTITVTITLNQANASDLSPNDAMRCLRGMVIILVENAESDGTFLDAMINAMNRVILFEAKNAGWLTIEHLGGFGEIEKRIVHYRARTPGPMRIFVCADSDALYPGHLTRTAQKVSDACTTHGVPFTILSKRKMENYLPVEALQAAGRWRPFQAFLRLNEEQRDFFEMKGGFSEDDRRNVIIPPEQVLVFEHVSGHVLRDLVGGFGKEVWRLYRYAASHITEDAVRRRCRRAPTELDDMLDNIERLL